LAEGNQRASQGLGCNAETVRRFIRSVCLRHGLRHRAERAAQPEQTGAGGFFQAQRPGPALPWQAVKGVSHAKVPAPANTGQSMNTNTSQLLRAGQKTGQRGGFSEKI
jgi:hypothetical protein